MKKMILFLILLHCVETTKAQNRILFRRGILFSDIASKYEEFRMYNDVKYAMWTSLGISVPIRKILEIETSLTYQNRKPLEVFPFPVAGGYHFLVGYPTSEQSKDYRPDFLIFPDFQYLHLEAVPVICVGRKLQCRIGIGLFYGILLNRDVVTRDRYDFPLEQFLFEPPFSAYGEVLYHRQDYGVLPQLSVCYPIANRITLGLSAKSYQSLTRLNDTHVFPWLDYNMRWSAYLLGLEAGYRF